mgnify:CR=1 FL=1
MNSTKQSSVNARKRKMMLVLPLLVLPFLTLAFWAMGGGKANVNGQPGKQISTGLNLHLPDPKQKKETILDKLGFYDKADKDSLKLKEEMRNDPYYQGQQSLEQTDASNQLEQIAQSSAGKFHQSSISGENKLNSSPYNTSTNQAEANLLQKLSELNKVINQPQTQPAKDEEFSKIDDNIKSDSKINGSVNRLEDMLQAMNQTGDSDIELEKLSGMMDKILDIQHPERINEQLKQKSLQQRSTIFSVSARSINDTTVNGFYSLDASTDATRSNAIEAVVNEDQVLVSGSVIKLRLTSDAYVKDIKIPAGNFVFGIVSLDGERLNVEINSIRSGNSVYPVKMQIYDMDW